VKFILYLHKTEFALSLLDAPKWFYHL